jgi:hypothetical protein
VNGLLRELLAAQRIVRHPEVAVTLKPLRLPTDGVPLWGVESVAVEHGYYAPDPRAGRQSSCRSPTMAG